MNARTLIGKVYNSIPESQHGFTEYPNKLAEDCSAAERQHRSGRGAVRGFSCADAGRYFTAKYLHNFASGKAELPTVTDFLSLRREYFTAAAVYCENKAALEAWAATVPAEFLALDYCDLMGTSQKVAGVTAAKGYTAGPDALTAAMAGVLTFSDGGGAKYLAMPQYQEALKAIRDGRHVVITAAPRDALAAQVAQLREALSDALENWYACAPIKADLDGINGYCEQGNGKQYQRARAALAASPGGGW